MWILLSGLPAVGKSALADELGHRLRLPVFSVDPIESAILRAGLAPTFETGLAAYLVVEALTNAQLGRGQGAIVDAVNSVDYAKKMWLQLGARHGDLPRIVECVCSDQALHRARLASRRRGLAPSFREPTWEDVERRRLEYTAWTEPVLVVDSVAPLESNVERVVEWLSRG
jgi:adenylate kinase family enzyme